MRRILLALFMMALALGVTAAGQRPPKSKPATESPGSAVGPVRQVGGLALQLYEEVRQVGGLAVQLYEEADQWRGQLWARGTWWTWRKTDELKEAARDPTWSGWFWSAILIGLLLAMALIPLAGCLYCFGDVGLRLPSKQWLTGGR